MLSPDLSQITAHIHERALAYDDAVKHDRRAPAPTFLIDGPSGSGKTTLAANLAWCAAEQSGHRTLLWDLDAANAGQKSRLSPWPGLTFGPCVLRPESRGQVRLAGSDPAVVPAIVHNWLDPTDMPEGILTLRWAEFAGGTPGAVVQQIACDVTWAVRSPDVTPKLEAIGASAGGEAGWGSAAARADDGMKTSGAGGRYPSDPCGRRVL